jgi:hypothetical protein
MKAIPTISYTFFEESKGELARAFPKMIPT